MTEWRKVICLLLLLLLLLLPILPSGTGCFFYNTYEIEEESMLEMPSCCYGN